MNNNCNISVVIPCRNEEKYIGACFDSLLHQNYNINNVEILVIDGQSTDNTRNIIKDYVDKYAFIKLIDNPNKTVPYALNIGIANSKNDYIIRIDVHCIYSESYLSDLVSWGQQLNADNIGGRIVTIPINQSIKAKCIAIVLNHPFGIGNSYFRIGANTFKEVDTVPFGCFKRELFDEIGLFDVDLTRNQDDEFNARIRKSGKKIYLIPSIEITYFARSSIRKLALMYYQYGYFKPLAARKVKGSVTMRQLIPATFVLALGITGVLLFIIPVFKWLFLGVIGAYLLTSLTISFFIALKKDIRLVFGLPIAFGTLHFSYGIGYLKGFIDFIILNKHKKKKINDISLSR